MTSTRDKLIKTAEAILGRKIPENYIPSSLSATELKNQLDSIINKTMRPKVSIKPRQSKWTTLAKKYFKNDTSLKNIVSTLAKGDESREIELTDGFKLILKKGRAAYFTSGSRPGVSANQWAYGRLYAVLFGSPGARKADISIIEDYNIPLLS